MDATPDVSIISHFKDLKDLRMERAKKHRLMDILVIALGSSLVGGDGMKPPRSKLRGIKRKRSL